MKSIWALVFSLTALLALGSNALGAPFIINDNPTAANTYWGGVSGPAQDVLGGGDSDI